MSKPVNLVWYDGTGERHVIGKAEVDRIDETGIYIKGEITDPNYKELLSDNTKSFSFAPVGFWEY